jgi:hypothetical protein
MTEGGLSKLAAGDALTEGGEAATNSHYHFDGRIKTKLLHVDYLMKHCQVIAQHGSQGTGI